MQWEDDDREFRKLQRRMKVLGNTEVLVGVFEDSKPREAAEGESAPTNVEVAVDQEFGKPGVPERSFIRAGIDHGREAIGEVAQQAMKDVLEGRLDVRSAGDRVGFAAVAEIQQTIRAGIAPELSETTKARRDLRLGKKGSVSGAPGAGSYTPLVDTGALWQSIVHKTNTGTGGGRTQKD